MPSPDGKGRQEEAHKELINSTTPIGAESSGSAGREEDFSSTGSHLGLSTNTSSGSR